MRTVRWKRSPCACACVHVFCGRKAFSVLTRRVNRRSPSDSCCAFPRPAHRFHASGFYVFLHFDHRRLICASLRLASPLVDVDEDDPGKALTGRASGCKNGSVSSRGGVVGAFTAPSAGGGCSLGGRGPPGGGGGPSCAGWPCAAGPNAQIPTIPQCS